MSMRERERERERGGGKRKRERINDLSYNPTFHVPAEFFSQKIGELKEN